MFLRMLMLATAFLPLFPVFGAEPTQAEREIRRLTEEIEEAFSDHDPLEAHRRVRQLEQHILELKLELSIRQWQQTHTSQLREESKPVPPPLLNVEGRDGQWVTVNNGTTKPAQGWVENGQVWIEGKWYPLSQVYRGIVFGKPVFTHPSFPRPTRTATVTTHPDGSKTEIIPLGASPSGGASDPKRPYGHYSVLDLETGLIRYLPLPGFNPATGKFDGTK